MPYGDPMILTTQDLLENGPLELWADTAQPADGFSFWTSAITPTFSRQSGTQTGGSGSYFQRMANSGLAVGNQQSFYQVIELLGHSTLAARGHSGMTFTISVWCRQSSGTPTIIIQPSILEQNSSGATLSTNRASALTLTGSWTQYTYSFTIANAATAKLQVEVYFTVTVGSGLATIDLDDFALTTTYTFVRNPTIPDDQTIIVPFRKMLRSFAGSLLRARPGIPALAKHEKRLVFAMIGRIQFEKFRSLWFLDSPLVWTPNHPHLPTTLIVRWTNDFDFRLLRTLSPEFYQGNMMLAEV